MKEYQKCSYCNREYPDGGFPYLELRNRNTPERSEVCLDLIFENILPECLSFCGIECLKEWMEKK